MYTQVDSKSKFFNPLVYTQITVMTKIISHSYTSGSINCIGKMASPKEPKNDAIVLIFHTWMGLNQLIIEKAEAIANLGFTAFAADMFGDGKVAKNTDDAAALIAPLFTNRKLLLERALAAYHAAKKIKQGKIAAMGYCFGGMCTLDLFNSGADLAGAISVHAVLGESLGDMRTKNLPRRKNIHGKLLILHGYKDPMAPVEELIKLQNELTKEEIDWQTHIFGTVAHGFTNPDAHDRKSGMYFDTLANSRATLLINDFLKEVLL